VDQVSCPSDSELIVLGEVTGHFGVKGWMKIKSFTRPADLILTYKSWWLSPQPKQLGKHSDSDLVPRSVFKVAEGRKQGRNLIVRLEGITNRDGAEPLIGRFIQVAAAELGPAKDGEYYWTDLIGLQVTNIAGEFLGEVDHLLETGANDVLVVLGKDDSGSSIERLLPWSEQVIIEVNLDQQTMIVDWDADF